MKLHSPPPALAVVALKEPLQAIFHAGSKYVGLSILTVFLLVACGGKSDTQQISEATKQTVADYGQRWDNKVQAVKEVAAVLEKHLGSVPNAVSMSLSEAQRFDPQRLNALLGKTQNAAVNEFALIADLEKIVQRFEAKDKPLHPKVAPEVANIAGLKPSADGVVTADDEIIDASNPMNIAQVVVMNATARGEDPEAAINHLRDSMLRKLQENPPIPAVIEDAEDVTGTSGNTADPQSLYVSCPWWSPVTSQGYSCLRWGSSIPYVFNGSTDNFSDAPLVTAMESAMHDWTSKTNGRVNFHRANGYEWLLSRLYLTGAVNITRIGGRTSYAQVGYRVGSASLQIAQDVFSNAAELKRHTRHELGHIIGLIHEHQRWDRDTYLSINEGTDPTNLRRIDLHSSIGWNMVVLEPKLVSFHYLHCARSGWWFRCDWRMASFTIWIPVWKYVEYKERTGQGSDQFDCHSVMLYGGKQTKLNAFSNDCLAQDAGGQPILLTKNNIDISPQDASTASNLIKQTRVGIFGWFFWW